MSALTSCSVQAVREHSAARSLASRRSHSSYSSLAQRKLEQRVAAARRSAGSRQRRLAAASATEQQAAAPSETSSSSNVAAALAGLRYASPDGAFLVRPMDKGNPAEVRRIVSLQTEAFHTPARLQLLDGMARQFFEAEVLSEMQKKLRFNPDDLFASLVVEPTRPAAGSSGSNIIGGVELSYIDNKETLKLLEPGTTGYCYIASMVVAPGWRRQGAACTLLAAAEVAVEAMDERCALLQVYQDNAPAVKLYQRQGYEIIGGQQKGLLGGLGQRPRYTMRKQW